MAEKTNPESKPLSVTIDNPDQASTNFYWKYSTTAGVFNLQTTIRGILSYDQITAHIKSALEASAHIVSLGGLAKQVGRESEDVAASPLPQPVPTDQILTEIASASLQVPQASALPSAAIPQAQPQQTADNSFVTQKLICEVKNNKHYYKITGGRWPKYGVTIWDEVLVAAGIPAANLEGKTYDLAGYKATYTLKANGDPEKIIKLEKVA